MQLDLIPLCHTNLNRVAIIETVQGNGLVANIHRRKSALTIPCKSMGDCYKTARQALEVDDKLPQFSGRL